jgi:hypothetical protein
MRARMTVPVEEEQPHWPLELPMVLHIWRRIFLELQLRS